MDVFCFVLFLCLVFVFVVVVVVWRGGEGGDRNLDGWSWKRKAKADKRFTCKCLLLGLREQQPEGWQPVQSHQLQLMGYTGRQQVLWSTAQTTRSS